MLTDFDHTGQTTRGRGTGVVVSLRTRFIQCCYYFEEDTLLQEGRPVDCNLLISAQHCSKLVVDIAAFSFLWLEIDRD